MGELPAPGGVTMEAFIESLRGTAPVVVTISSSTLDRIDTTVPLGTVFECHLAGGHRWANLTAGGVECFRCGAHP